MKANQPTKKHAPVFLLGLESFGFDIVLLNFPNIIS